MLMRRWVQPNRQHFSPLVDQRLRAGSEQKWLTISPSMVPGGAA
jgi:hypothetical protein